MKSGNRMIYLSVGCMIMLLAGTVYTWTIISRSISASFPAWSAQTLSMTFTFSMMGYALGGLASGILVKRVGPRPVLAAAAVLFPGGMAAASFAQTPSLLYLGFGMMCGFAAGLCYNSTVSTVSAWFPDRQGIASGTLLAAFGLSSFIAGKLFAAFAPADGSRTWAAGLRVLAILLLAVLLLGVLVMRFPEAGEAAALTGQKDTAADALSGQKAFSDSGLPEAGRTAEAASCSSGKKGKNKNRREPACDIPTREMVRRSSFWLFYIWAALLTGSGLLLVSQASGIAAEVGKTLSGNTIATAVGMISILNAAGRICTGSFYDRFGYRKTMFLVMGSFAASAVMMLLAIRTGAFPLIVTGFVAGGFAYGGVASISPPLIADFYGRTWYSTNFSLIPTNALFTSFASVLAGRMYDRTHSFFGPLLLLLGAVLLSLA
ncbi:MAG: MFS transporter, partial [Eubacteriales bacterium]|nr:MFS transporter [Eubacteriales bacterium]